MKSSGLLLILIVAATTQCFAMQPFGEDPISIEKSQSEVVETPQPVEEVVTSLQSAEPRPDPEQLEMQIIAYFKTLDILSQYPEKMSNFIARIDRLEEDIARSLMNEIDYGTQTFHQRRIGGEGSAELRNTQLWTKGWVDRLHQVTMASAQFRNIALGLESPVYSPQASDDAEPSETEEISDSSSPAFQADEDSQSAEESTNVSQVKAKPVEKPQFAISEKGRQQMARVVSHAMNNHRGASRGMCFNAVWGYLSKSGYGNIDAWGDLPRMKSGLARYFADFMNAGQGNLNEAGLQRLDTMLKPPITNPHDQRIPVGAVIVVAAGRTGTSDPVAGDIVIKGNGRFINDGPDMWYGEPGTWRGKLLGVYVPK